MKKNITMLLAVIALAVIGFTYHAEAVSYAKNVVQVMQSPRGNEVQHSTAYGKTYSRFSSVTEASICTGKCLIYDVILASGADGAYVILYDSAPATAGTTTIVGKLEFDGTGHGSLSQGSNAFPIVTTRGIGIDMSSVSGSEEALVIYQDLD